MRTSNRIFACHHEHNGTNSHAKVFRNIESLLKKKKCLWLYIPSNCTLKVEGGSIMKVAAYKCLITVKRKFLVLKQFAKNFSESSVKFTTPEIMEYVTAKFVTWSVPHQFQHWFCASSPPTDVQYFLLGTAHKNS